eukprot:TRINITY_DN3227_c0_g1_i3.p1 TRINITY_DN3227_c0_g1~~TRINITY_DN3227_c0_g1_i3.p1  ORF type:complete len:153 (-),score=45.94 TRINITY_DN3227_c0_g1_i3:102-560(-)
MARDLATTLLMVIAVCVIDVGAEFHDPQVTRLDSEESLLSIQEKADPVPHSATRTKVRSVLGLPSTTPAATQAQKDKGAKNVAAARTGEKKEATTPQPGQKSVIEKAAPNKAEEGVTAPPPGKKTTEQVALEKADKGAPPPQAGQKLSLIHI